MMKGRETGGVGVVFAAVIAAVSLVGIFWVRSVMTLEHGLRTGWMIKEGAGTVIQLVLVVLFALCALGIIRSVSKSSAARVAAAPPVAPVPAEAAQPPQAAAAVGADAAGADAAGTDAAVSAGADALRELATLRDEGVITEEEFVAKKAELLAKM